MNTEKQVKMSLELAKQMLGKDEAMDMLIKQNFSDEELGINPELPKTWEGIGFIKGYYVSNDSQIIESKETACVNPNKNILPTKELAHAMRALCQLLYLRDIYNDGWQPDWDNNSQKCVITVVRNEFAKDYLIASQRILFFKKRKLRDEFLENFKDLLEIAKPLL